MSLKIAISGKLRSGKTTIMKIFQEESEKKGIKLVSIPLATPIYDEAYDFYKRHNLTWEYKDRKLLEAIGEAFNDKYSNGDKLVELYKERIKDNNESNIIVDDVRRITQADFFKNNHFVLIRIECSEEKRKLRCNDGEWSKGSISDIELDNYPYFNFIINNDFYELNDEVINKLRNDVIKILDKWLFDKFLLNKYIR